MTKRLLDVFIVIAFVTCSALVLPSFAYASNANVAAEERGGSPDVRVVIDVSGSMKQNDPENLRIPAVKILSKLLPGDATAGIWTFGQHVNMLVKHGPANAVWKENARIRADKINSVALRTNIGEALERVSWDLTSSAPLDRHIILLTDGQIDVSADPQTNQDSRQKILKELLPELVEAGIQVHTLALSEQADRQFLRQISMATNGYHGLVASPEALAEYFLKVLDVAAPAIEVPISSAEGFIIDEAVDEFTVLMFRNGDTKNKLIDPDGRIVDVTFSFPGMRWFEDKTFDLVTLQRPQPGRWRVVGGGEEDRVTVVSNLKLIAEPLSSTIYPGFTANWQVYLADGKQIITDPQLLKLVNFGAEVVGESETRSLLVTPSEGTPPNGIYLIKISTLDHPGEYQFNVTASSPTFERQARRVSVLRDPVSLTTKTVAGEAEIWIDIADANINYQSLSVVARVRRNREPQQIRPLTQASHGNWVITLGNALGDHEIALNIKGKYLNNNDFNLNPTPLKLTLPLEGEERIGLSMQGVVAKRTPLVEDVASPPSPVVETPAKELETQTEAPANETPEMEEIAEEVVDETPPWLMIGIITLLNLVGFAAIWWFFLKPKAKKEESSELDGALTKVTDLLKVRAERQALLKEEEKEGEQDTQTPKPTAQPAQDTNASDVTAATEKEGDIEGEPDLRKDSKENEEDAAVKAETADLDKNPKDEVKPAA